MDLGLEKRTVMVTGGASNIGRAIVLGFAAEGANVCVADLDLPNAEKVAAEARRSAGSAMALETDVTQLASAQRTVAAVLLASGRIDVLVNTAGWWDRPTPFVDSNPELWGKLVAVNYFGVVNCVRAVLPHMIDRGSGSVVSIASDAARVGDALSAVYSGAKAAVLGFSKAVAREVGPRGVRVNVVCPGATIPASRDVVGALSPWRELAAPDGERTPDRDERLKRAYPLRRLGAADDIARAVAFLASEAASFVTGQTFSVSGGFTMI
jgi:2-hydroxycyclohexanecarboxyl-CoA dehydrogenase